MPLFKLPPPPVGQEINSPAYRDWFYKIQQFLGNVGNILFTALDFTGSNLTSIVTRNHNDLQNIQGGTTTERYHLTAAQASAIAGGVLSRMGLDGEQGEEGPMGPPGRDGVGGVSGATGPAGATIYIQGFDGEIGEDGAQGFPGPQGSTGIQGITGGQGPTGPAIFLEAADGEDALWGPPGNQGIQGPIGSTGNQGTVGAQGPIGQQGIVGIGLDGIDGDDGVPIPGPIGATGSTGIQGVAGVTGPQGPIGFGLDGEDGGGDNYYLIGGQVTQASGSGLTHPQVLTRVSFRM
jgi:hypothetical protein